MLTDLAVIRRDIRLALRGIDDQGIRHLILRRIEFNICRESGTAKTYKTGVSDHLDKVLEGLDLWRFAEGIDRVVKIRFDTYGLDRRTISGNDVVNFFNSSGNTGVDRYGHGFIGAPDQRSDIDVITRPDHTRTGRSDMLLHQQLDLGESMQMNGWKNIGIFIAERMHTTGKCMYRSKRHEEYLLSPNI